MMKVNNLPLASGSLQLVFKPVELPLVYVVADERKEPDTFFRLEGVVMLPAHIEFFVIDLSGRVVMISESRVKLHARVQQRLIRLFELLFEVLRRFPSVKVVA